MTSDSDRISIAQWGVKKDLTYQDGGFYGDAILFHFEIPDSMVHGDTLDIQTLKGKPAELLCLRFTEGSVPKYVSFTRNEMTPHYLGKLSNGCHLVEMVGKYPTDQLGDIRRFNKHLSDIKLEFQFH